jgi:hypothetical protein
VGHLGAPALPKMLSGGNVFEISDIQEGETAAVVTKRVECNNVIFH